MEKTWSWSASGVFLGEESFDDIRRLCRYAGFSGIEGLPAQFDKKKDTELEKIGKDFQSDGLSIQTFHLPYAERDDIASFYEADRRRAVDHINIWMERASILGASVCIQHSTTHQGSADLEGFDPYLKQLAKSLGSLLPAAESLGVTIALENSLPRVRGRFGSRPEHLRVFIREFDHPNFGLCLDTGHAQVAGGMEGAIQLFEAMEPRLVAFHMQDNAGDRDSHLAPGRGLVNWNGVFGRLARIGFDRAVCIEAPPFAPGPGYSMEDWKGLVDDTEKLANQSK